MIFYDPRVSTEVARLRVAVEKLVGLFEQNLPEPEDRQPEIDALTDQLKASTDNLDAVQKPRHI